MSLTAKKVDRLARPGRYHDGDQLYLQVTNPRNKSWIFRYERDGVEHAMGLGSTRTFTLKEARQRARAARQQLADGIDPLAARREAKQAKLLATARALTFGQAAEKYLNTQAPTWSAKHTSQWAQTVLGRTLSGPSDEDHCKALRPLPVAAVDKTMVLSVLEPLWATKVETGSRVRSRIEAVLAWATVFGYREGPNPAQWKNYLDKILAKPSKVAKPKHFPTMPYDQVPAFMAALVDSGGQAASALRFMVLTAARPGEALNALWSEIDLAKATWTIPGERMKGRVEHRVPLTEPALNLLRQLPRDEGALVFISANHGKPLSDKALSRQMQRMKTTAVPHGLRSCFSDWGHERSGIDPIVIEMSLAHKVGSAVAQAYRRSDLIERRARLMEMWATFVTSPPAVEGDTVVPLRGRSK
jgi:integrase